MTAVNKAEKRPPKNGGEEMVVKTKDSNQDTFHGIPWDNVEARRNKEAEMIAAGPGEETQLFAGIVT